MVSRHRRWRRLDQDVVDYFVAHCTAEMIRLEHCGCPWSRKIDDHVNVRAFDPPARRNISASTSSPAGLEQVEDKYCQRLQDRKHRFQRCDDFYPITRIPG